MNIYKIYQVRNDDAEIFRAYAFGALDWILREHPECRGEMPQLPREAWELVYTWETEKEPSLDYIFTTFNRNQSGFDIAYEPTPEDFTGHSMSVSDIVEYPDGRLWFCDSLGWKEVQWAAPEKSAQSPAQRVCAEEDEHRSERAFEPAKKRDDAEIVRTKWQSN